MIGRVTAYDGGYFTVECPDAPPHLQVLHLIPRQMLGADVGATVRLAYQITSRSGLWNVVEVLDLTRPTRHNAGGG